MLIRKYVERESIGRFCFAQPASTEEVAEAVRESHSIVSGGYYSIGRLPTRMRIARKIGSHLLLQKTTRKLANASERSRYLEEIAADGTVDRESLESIFPLLSLVERDRRIGEIENKILAGEATFGDHPPLSNATSLSLRSCRGIVEHFADDQVVIVRSGTTLEELQQALREKGQCLPIHHFDGLGALARVQDSSEILELIDVNFPHFLEFQCGTWRDWILGMTVVQSDGTIAKCGSQAVKNVAGYDVQRLMIGARGSLGVISEVILRTYPLKALPQPEIHSGTAKGGQQYWLQRVLPSDFEAAISNAGDSLIAADRAKATLWCNVSADQSLERFPDDWVLRSGCGAKNVEINDQTLIRLMKRAKGLFDPDCKLNAGEFGFI